MFIENYLKKTEHIPVYEVTKKFEMMFQQQNNLILLKVKNNFSTYLKLFLSQRESLCYKSQLIGETFKYNLLKFCLFDNFET